MAFNNTRQSLSSTAADAVIHEFKVNYESTMVIPIHVVHLGSYSLEVSYSNEYLIERRRAKEHFEIIFGN